MMKLTLITLLLLLTAAWNLYITTPSPTTSPTTEPTIVPTPTVADKPKPVNQYIKIGAFNIQSFGKTKYGRVDVRNHLVKIVTQYDAIVIQEIKDKSQTMIKDFLADCQIHRNFSMALSKRLGRSSRYMEQYALFYDQDKLSVLKHTVYADPLDVFHREPMIAHLRDITRGKDLTLIAVHTDPDDVPEELGEMDKAYDWAISQGYPTNALMMGDFNADCNYFKTSEYSSVPLATDSKFTWLINGSADTTVSDKTNCAYDRFVAVGSAHYVNTTIDRFDLLSNLTVDEAKKVSDHYPIMTFWELL